MADLITKIGADSSQLRQDVGSLPSVVKGSFDKMTLWRLEKRWVLRPIPQLRHKRYSASAVESFASGSTK